MVGWIAILWRYYETQIKNHFPSFKSAANKLFERLFITCEELFDNCLNFWLLEKNVTYFEIWEEDNITKYDLCRAVHLFGVLWQKTTLLESSVVPSVILQQNEYIKSNGWLKCQKHCFISKQFKWGSNPVSYLHSFFFAPASFSFSIMCDQCHGYSPSFHYPESQMAPQ